MNEIGEFFASNVFSGSMLLAVPLALIAGLVSFLSPCVLPLLPGFLGYVSGTTDPDDPAARNRTVAGATLFVLGFSVVFIAFGAAFGVIGLWLTQWQDVITRVLGLFVVAMGLVLVGAVRFLHGSVRPRWAPATGLAGAPLLGFTFGLSWTPCIGPTLSAVVALSLSGGDPSRGALLGLAYCLGLGAPFILAAAGVGWAARGVRVVRRHIRTINLVGGGLLVLVGVLMLTGAWSAIILGIQGWIGGFVTVI